MTDLTSLEIADLERLETTIQKHQQAFVECGLAIAEIRDRKLYRKDYDTFEGYCQARWGWSRQRAQQLERAAKLVEALPEKSAALVPDEMSARTLAEIPANQRAPILQKLARAGEPINPCSISKKADSIAPKVSTYVDKPKNDTPKEEAERLDCIGREIPDEIVADWDRAATVANRLRSCASEIKVTVERGLADKDIIFAEITNPTIAEASGLHYTLSQIAPYAVCPQCQGRQKSNCQLCRRRGWISRYLYNSPAVSSETKSIIEKSLRK